MDRDPLLIAQGDTLGSLSWLSHLFLRSFLSWWVGGLALLLHRPRPQVLLCITMEARALKIVQAKGSRELGSMALRSLLKAEDG